MNCMDPIALCFVFPVKADPLVLYPVSHAHCLWDAQHFSAGLCGPRETRAP